MSILSAPSGSAKVPGDDRSESPDERRSDKQNDKLSDKRSTRDPALATVIEAWAKLPEPLKTGILATVEAASQPDSTSY